MRKEVLKFLVLALLAMGAGPAGAALWQWSLTPANNGTADPSINWAVGMAPSAVDPSARSMMARTAEWRDDISGSVTSTGTSTAYVVTTNQSNGGNPICGTGTTPQNGQMIAFTAHVTSGSNPTLAVDNCTAVAIVSQLNVFAPVGTLIQGTPYSLKYNSATAQWVLRNYYGAGGIPLGAMIPYTLASAPNSSFILPAGQCISTTTYANYWALLGSPAPGGCAANTFAVIDMRGRVPAALDNLNGTAANRLTSAATGCGTAMTSVGAVCANGNESHTLTVTELAAHTHANSLSDPGHSHSTNANIQNAAVGVAADGVIVIPSNGAATVNANTTGISINNASAGGGGAHPVTQPTIGTGYLLRVL